MSVDRDRVERSGNDNSEWRMETLMIHSFKVTFGAKYLTGMVTSVPPPKLSVVLKNYILHHSKNYRNHFENSYI
jgi:hypothetical protein